MQAKNRTSNQKPLGFVDKELAQSLSELVDTNDVSILTALYAQIREPGAGVNAKRFRADNRYVRDRIAELEQESLIVKSYDDTTEAYRLSLLSLAALKQPSADEILAASDEVLRYMADEYLNRLDAQVRVSEILGNVSSAATTTRWALAYLKGTLAIGGGSSDFPTRDDSYTLLGEQLLDYDSLNPLLWTMFKWIGRPRQPASTTASTATTRTYGFEAQFRANLDGHWTEALPLGIREVVSEIDGALNFGLSILPAFGIRTAIELCCVDKVGRRDRLPDLLSSMVDLGHLTDISVASLGPVIELGNASAHAGYKPQTTDLETAVAVTAALLNQLYHIAPRTKELSERVPKRPRSKAPKRASDAKDTR